MEVTGTGEFNDLVGVGGGGYNVHTLNSLLFSILIAACRQQQILVQNEHFPSFFPSQLPSLMTD